VKIVTNSMTRKQLVVVLSLVAVCLGAAPASHATTMRGQASDAYHHSEVDRGAGYEGHREGHRDPHHGELRPRIYWIYPYNRYYPYSYRPAPSLYWYYCESYGLYYPSVLTCPESWIVVPAS